MKLNLVDQGLYPKFTNYIRFQFPKLANNALIAKNVKQYGHLDLAEFKNALAWGSLPEIVITDLHHGQCGVPRAYGCFRHAAPGKIEIHIDVVNDFENKLANTIDNNAKGSPVYVAGATLLHELCHWGNHNNVPPIPELIEMGAAFEQATYGKVIY